MGTKEEQRSSLIDKTVDSGYNCNKEYSSEVCILKKLWIFIAVFLLTVGCASCTQSDDGVDGSNAADIIPHEEHIQRSDGASVDIHVSYPVFNLENVAVSDRINEQIKEYVDSLYSYYYEKESLVATDTLHSTMQYDVTLLDETYASIHFYASMAGGSSPQYVIDKGFTFDLSTGETVSLLELYTADEIRSLIDSYFAALDESAYPVLFFLYPKEQIKEDFLNRFDQASSADTAFYHYYYISENTLYLFAGLYDDYSVDVDSQFHGRRSFTITCDIEKSSES